MDELEKAKNEALLHKSCLTRWMLGLDTFLRQVGWEGEWYRDTDGSKDSYVTDTLVSYTDAYGWILDKHRQALHYKCRVDQLEVIIDELIKRVTQLESRYAMTVKKISFFRTDWFSVGYRIRKYWFIPRYEVAVFRRDDEYCTVGSSGTLKEAFKYVDELSWESSENSFASHSGGSKDPKPCPECGSTSIEKKSFISRVTMSPRSSLSCTECGHTIISVSNRGAVAHWNFGR